MRLNSAKLTDDPTIFVANAQGHTGYRTIGDLFGSRPKADDTVNYFDHSFHTTFTPLSTLFVVAAEY